MRPLLSALLGLAALPLVVNAAPVQLTVDTQRVLRTDADKFIGINLNYIRDADANRPAGQPLVKALQTLGVHWLRFPGGEKSDFHRWALPPYDKPQPVSLKWYAGNPGTRMDFDQYMTLVRQLGAEPYIVVGYDTEKRTGLTKAEWIESAAAWVRYANKVKGYGVKYWEIGNEDWHNGTASASGMAQIVVEFARAMKAVDPGIRIGSGGCDQWWWEGFLPVAAPAMDFITISLYNCEGWGGYGYFPAHLDSDTIGKATQALDCLKRFATPEDAARIQLIAAETNSKDFAKNGWPGRNNLGHALVLFDTIGRLMMKDQVRAAMVWTTRWMKDEEAANSQWYALGPRNEILPTGRAIEMWGRFVQPQLVAVSGVQKPLRAYAARSADGKNATVWVLNASTSDSVPVSVALTSPVAFRSVKSYVFSGRNPEDDQPQFAARSSQILNQNKTGTISCPPLSITVLTLE